VVHTRLELPYEGAMTLSEITRSITTFSITLFIIIILSRITLSQMILRGMTVIIMKLSVKTFRVLQGTTGYYRVLCIMTLGVMTFIIMTLSKTTLSIMTFSMMTLSKATLNVTTFSIVILSTTTLSCITHRTQHKNKNMFCKVSLFCHCSECCYAEYSLHNKGHVYAIRSGLSMMYFL
jgi:hypothetical protein